MNPVELPSPPNALSFDDLKVTAAQPSWLWHGFVAAGNVTLLTSLWKAGKTTLTLVLLARMKHGGGLAGAAVKPGRAAIVSEEGPSHWVRRGERLDLTGHSWFCRPFRTKPRPAEWVALLDRVAELHRREPLALAVIDPLASFLPGRDENSAGTMLEALLPLQRLTAEGMAVLVLHHPSKGEPRPGQMARGSGALSGYADVIVEMSWYSRSADFDRRRKLRAWSRHDETPRELVIELNEEGTDYRSLGDFEAEAFRANWSVLERLLTEAGEKLTRRQLLDRWPPEVEPPGDTTLWRWLEKAVAEGKMCRSGQGHKFSPYQYWLASRGGAGCRTCPRCRPWTGAIENSADQRTATARSVRINEVPFVKSR